MEDSADIGTSRPPPFEDRAMANLTRHTFDAVREPLLVLDAGLSVQAASAPFYRAFRVSPEETIGRPIYELGNGQWNIPRLRELLENLLPLNRQLDDFEVEHEFESIGARTMLLNARLIAESQLILLAIEDSTDRRRGEAAVARALEQAQKTIDTVREPMLVLDHELRIRNANQSFFQVFDVTEESALGEVVYDIGNGQWDIPALHALLEDVLPDNNFFNDFIVDHDFPSLGRRTMLLNARRIDHVQLVLLAFEDITERQRAAQDLQASEARFRALFEQSSVAIYEIEPTTARLISANLTLCSMLGYAEPALIGKTTSELTFLDDREVDRQGFQRLGEQFVHQIDKRLLRSDGSTLWVHETLNLLRDASGLPIRVIGVAVDITDRKAAEAAMRSALQAKDEFLGLISHELRTPLTIIQGNALTLAKGVPLDEMGKTDALRDIATESGRLGRIIDNMLYLARLEAGKAPELEPVSLSHAVEKEASEFTRRHPDAPIAVARIDGDIVVEANEEYIRRILENLLSNAFKYSSPGAPIQVSGQVLGAMAEVTVSDRGIGLMGNASDLFQPFYRENETVSGLGIGLAVCKRLVEAQGGHIQAQPREGGGSAFSFTIPLATPTDRIS